MPLTLHEAVVPTWLQILGSVERLVGRAEAWCEEHGHPPGELLDARLAEDMLPFAYQVKSCWTHSALALEGVAAGRFEPHMDAPPGDFAGLRDTLRTSKEALEGTDPDRLEAIARNDMVFAIGDKLRLDFTVQDFLLGFSNPNFHFHATTAYDILRLKGLPVGKQDFLGRMPVKTA